MFVKLMKVNKVELLLIENLKYGILVYKYLYLKGVKIIDFDMKD